MRRVSALLRIAEALVGNRHLGREPILHELAGGREQRVPRGVPTRDPAEAAARSATAAATTTTMSTSTPAAALRIQDRVALHAEAVHRKYVGALLIEKGIKIDRENVVSECPVPIRAIRADDGRIGVVGVEPEVEVGAVVRDVDLGRLGGRRTIEGLALYELDDPRRIAPSRIVEPTVDDGRAPDTHRAHAWTPGQCPGLDGYSEPRCIVPDDNATGDAVGSHTGGLDRRRRRGRRATAHRALIKPVTYRYFCNVRCTRGGRPECSRAGRHRRTGRGGCRSHAQRPGGDLLKTLGEAAHDPVLQCEHIAHRAVES